MAWVYESLYPYKGRPVFVTTDAAYHHWHLVFDKVLRDVEQLELLPELESLLTSAVASARAQTTRTLRDRRSPMMHSVSRSTSRPPRRSSVSTSDRSVRALSRRLRSSKRTLRSSGLPDRRRSVPSSVCRLLADDTARPLHPDGGPDALLQGDVDARQRRISGRPARRAAGRPACVTGSDG